MSHVALCKLSVKSLDALEQACEMLGLKLIRDKKTYSWFGSWVNDYHADDAAYLQGVDPKDYGKCEHCIVDPNNKNAYEIGVIKSPDGVGYKLIFDFYGSRGKAMSDKVGGHAATKLHQVYACCNSAKDLQRKGFSTKISQNETTGIWQTIGLRKKQANLKR